MSTTTMQYKADYMDIDEILSSPNLCEDLGAFAESGVDFSALTDSVDFTLSAEQLHEYTADPFDIEAHIESAPSPVSSDEGRGKSISSELSSGDNTSVLETNIISDDLTHNRGRKLRRKSVNSEKDDGSKARTSTWKVTKPAEKQCLATSVEIEGVSYTYNLIPTSRARKPNRKSVPGSQKDEKYWDRRSKNNEAAKRSRDLRRRKEMLVASRAADLEMQNEELRAEVTFLKERVEVLNKQLQEKPN